MYLNHLNGSVDLSSIDELVELTIVVDDNSSTFLSFLLQNYINFPDNSCNNELFLQCIINNPAIDCYLLDQQHTTGKYLIQLFVKSLSMANPPGFVNYPFMASTDLFLHCCRVIEAMLNCIVE